MPSVKSCINIFSCIYCIFHIEESLVPLVNWFILHTLCSSASLYQFLILIHWRLVKA